MILFIYSPQPYRNTLFLAIKLVGLDVRRSNDVSDLELRIAPLTLRDKRRILFVVSSPLRLQAVSTCAMSCFPAV